VENNHLIGIQESGVVGGGRRKDSWQRGITRDWIELTFGSLFITCGADNMKQNWKVARFEEARNVNAVLLGKQGQQGG